MRESGLLGSRAVGIVVALYIVLVIAASLYFNISLTADRVAVLLLIAALATGRVRTFLRDWSAFVIVVLAWQILQGMSHTVTHLKPHVAEMITVDRFLFFGHVPTIWLQQHFYGARWVRWRGVTPDQIGPAHWHGYWAQPALHWYDVAASIFYTMHFVFPLFAAFLLWFWRRDVFLQFMTAFLLLALAGFATYVVFPAAPPWIAANWWHRLPHVTRIFQFGISVFGGQQSYSALTQWTWQHGGYDLFGAFPSEHAAFPFLCFLFLRKAYPRFGWLALPYCLCVWLSVVYLGEHYVTDVLGGILYASVVYVAVQVAVLRRQPGAARAQESGAVATHESLPA